MQDFETLTQPLLGELAMSRKRERKRRREKMPFIVATYVYACSPRAVHTLCSDQYFVIGHIFVGDIQAQISVKLGGACVLIGHFASYFLPQKPDIYYC
jgi:hypothetical protein